MAQDSDNHKFNNDLLANEGDRRLAKDIYPRLRHVLYHPELLELFSHYDALANTAKKRSHCAGLVAILLGTFALISASTEAFFHESHQPPRMLGVVSAMAGILSVAIGLWGVLYGKAKRRWLYQRLMTERLRQFHFQTFVSHLPDIIASLGTPGGIDAYKKTRDRWFNDFKARYKGHLDAELTRIIDGSKEAKESDVWLHEPPIRDPSVLRTDLSEVFAAYKALRITHQLQYANYKLRQEGSLWALSPKKLGEILSQAAFLCVVFLFALHLAIAIGLSIPSWKGVAAFARHPCVHVAALWCAIFALAIRALEEGLGVRDETERYRDYRSSVEVIRERFEQASDPKEKLRIMEEMERMSYDEMCSFLRDAHDTRFVM